MFRDWGQAFPTSHCIYSPTTTPRCRGTSVSMGGSVWVKIPSQCFLPTVLRATSEGDAPCSQEVPSLA